MHRIILCGPPLSGKSTLLGAFARSRGFALTPFEERAAGVALWRGVRVELGEVELLTISGSYLTDPWPSLVSTATCLVNVIDPQVVRASTTSEFLLELNALPGLPSFGCTCWTKQDLFAGGPEQAISRSVVRGTFCGGWAAFETRLDRPTTLVAPIEWLLREIDCRPRIRVRASRQR